MGHDHEGSGNSRLHDLHVVRVTVASDGTNNGYAQVRCDKHSPTTGVIEQVSDLAIQITP
jgi:hypothetical protein